jgi:hypothetical protein
VPDAPTKPTLVSQAATAIAISWVELPETQNGGSPVLDYQIYWDDPTDADGLVLIVSATQPNFQYTFTGLTSGREYKFTLTAVNIVGAGPQSEVSAFIAA